jgi:hypothetical protein
MGANHGGVAAGDTSGARDLIESVPEARFTRLPGWPLRLRGLG